MKAAASAPGKVILFGEHFVVHGNPAIVSSISLRAKVEAEKIPEEHVKLEGFEEDNPAIVASRYVLGKLRRQHGLKLRIFSEIPQSVGLGSSAAVSVAAAAATMKLCLNEIDLPLVLEAAHEGEKIIHYTPSGIDTSVATFGGGGVYSRAEGYRRLDLKLEYVLIVNTGKLRRTGDLVRKVKAFQEKNPEKFRQILASAGGIVSEAIDHLKSLDLESLGKLMNKNQELLRTIGVSSPEIEEAVAACLDAGAYGAKLTGAGGGGCVIAVADYDKLDQMREKLEGKFSVVKARLMVEGVRAEPSISSP